MTLAMPVAVVQWPGERAKQNIARAISWTSGGVLAVLLILLMVATAPAYLGYHQSTVLGGSMGNSLPVGSVAVTKTIPAEAIAVGDVIAVGHGDHVPSVLHRVVAIEDVPEGRLVITRGDANPTADPGPQLITGRGDRVVYYVPWAGYLLAAARTNWGVGLIGAIVLLLLAPVLAGRLRRAEPPPEAATGPLPARTAPVQLAPLPRTLAAWPAPSSTLQPRMKSQRAAAQGIDAVQGIPRAA